MARHLLKRLTRRLEPYVDQITENHWVKKYAPALTAPDLWHLNRRSSARAVAIGLFSGLVPGPFQVISAVGLSLLLRAHFPLAAITTLYTNPFTIVPLYLLAYQYGNWFIPGPAGPVDAVPSLGMPNYFTALFHWMGQLGKPLVVGLVMLALTLAGLGWIAVRVAWRCHAVWAWRRRARLRMRPAT